MKELFSIGDAADFVGITRRIILNYEAHGLVFPDVKEEPSGNRYYTIDTLTKIRTIRSLQNLGCHWMKSMATSTTPTTFYPWFEGWKRYGMN